MRFNTFIEFQNNFDFNLITRQKLTEQKIVKIHLIF